MSQKRETRLGAAGRNGIHHSSTPTPNLPVVSFRKVTDEPEQLEGVHDHQARTYGYNDPNFEFKRPEAYIRYVEPLESELRNQVEYDMDEQDQEWLDALNAERKKEQANTVTYETFEVIIDKIEKEWFELTKRFPKSDAPGPSEDSTCAICDDAEVENSNAIVFCDGCNLAVHQECYGVPYIPEGQWLCRKCQISPEQPVSCVLCPNEGGAFKQTSTGSWAHLLCAMYIAETSVGNSVIQEPIEGIERIEKARWKLVCSICNNGAGHGACIQCAKTLCYTAYHVTCARKYKLLMPMKGAEGEKLQLTSYCSKHVPEPQQAAHLEVLQAEEEGNLGHSDEESDSNSISRRGRLVKSTGALDTPKSKSARAYAKTYTLGAPLVPAIIVEKVMQYIQKISVHKKLAFVQMACRYWSLKREARRGAPLLKRLYLEPWNGSSADQKMTDEERATKLKYTQVLRKDLETVRMIAELARKREMRKLEQAHIAQDLLSEILYPHENTLRGAFEKIIALDRHDLFKAPVSKTDAPDYYDVVKDPMCWNQIDEKLDRHEYWDIEALRADIHLVLENALLYNKKETTFYRLADRMRHQSDEILKKLDPLRKTDLPSEVGELEPRLQLLELFFNQEEVGEALPHFLNDEPLDSFFKYEFEVRKPQRKVPRPPKKSKKPPPRDYAAERARRKARLEEQAKADALKQPTTPEPEYLRARTRGEAAKQAAFINEAGVAVPPGADPPESPSRRQRQPRDPLVLPGQSSEPPVVESVDAQQSFKMFDGGWILPSSQKRGGRTTVEKGDGPPPRKRQRKSDKGAPLSGDSTSQPLPSTSKTEREPSESKLYMFPDSESELSSLSELTDEEEEQEEEEDLDPEAKAVAHLHLKPGHCLDNGTLVWAKMESYPSWPAAVWGPDTKEVPKSVKKLGATIKRKEPGPLHLVQFYDSTSSWQWLEPSRLHLLGEDEEFDAAMVTGKSSHQRFKNNKLRAECRAAYRKAKAGMEVVEQSGTEEDDSKSDVEMSAPIKMESTEPELLMPLQAVESQFLPAPLPEPQLQPATFTFVHVNPGGYNLRS